MAVIRDNIYGSHVVDYFATAALFCAVAAMVGMLKFLGFRATMTFTENSGDSKDNASQSVSSGVYRAYKEEFYGNGSLPNPPKKISPSMVRLPENAGTTHKAPVPLHKNKSVPDLRTPVGNASVNTNNLSKSTVDIAQNAKTDPKTTSNIRVNPKDAKNQEKELKKMEKQRLAEEKKREQKAKADALKEAKEKAAREAKLKKEREKAEKERIKAEGKKKTKAPAAPGVPPPPPMPNSSTNPHAQPAPVINVTNPLAKSSNMVSQGRPPQGYSTNTLESSISRSSGPPPYTPQDKSETIPNERDNGNTSFGKPIEEGNSWDFISQHREQMSRPLNVNAPPRKKGTTLQYSVGNVPKLDDNSEA